MSRRAGFANPEYLLTLTAVAIFLAIAVPRFLQARQRARNLHALAVVREALSRYAADTKTKGPVELSDLAKGGKYLKALPELEIPGHHEPSSEVHPMSSEDTGGWGYSAWPGDPRQGQVWINCTHTDASGRAWNSF